MLWSKQAALFVGTFPIRLLESGIMTPNKLGDIEHAIEKAAAVALVFRAGAA